MEIPSNLVAYYTATVQESNGNYYIPIPRNEVEQGSVQAGDKLKVGLVDVGNQSSRSLGSKSSTRSSRNSISNHNQQDQPPVEEGDVLEVEITDLGDEGDGLARVAGGYVILVENANIGDNVSVEITTVKKNLAFAKIHNSSSEQVASN